MTSSELLQQAGIAETSLSPSVKEGINQVLKAATMEGVSQLSKILKTEAEKRGVVIGGTTDSASADAAVLAAKEQYDREQAAAKRKKIILVSVGAVALLVAIVVGVFYLKKKP